MSQRNWTKLALVALLMATVFSLTACARHGYGYGAGFVVRTPPPPPMSRSFVGHAPGPGYVWVPGHWMRVRDGYAWREGRWRR